jgi:glucosamine--fructose-6-phosphate aminotransferase (isomerizing)
MIKEIHEQPVAFEKILTDTRQTIRTIALEAWRTKHPDTFYLVGCGSSYYAALIPGFYFEYYLGLNAVVVPSSEFVWYAPRPQVNSPILIGLSRSGKTSETVEATRKAKRLGIPTVAVTSDAQSTMAQECDYNLNMGISTDESVIMTKTFTASALSSLLLGIEFAKIRGGNVPENIEDELSKLANDARAIIQAVEAQAKKVAEASGKIARYIYLGSGACYGACLEGALKLRETSYAASEAYHSMEFRHGPFAELQENIMVVALVPRGKTVAQQLTLLREIKATGAAVVPISDAPEVLDLFESSIRMPQSISTSFSALLYMIPMQLFAYYYAVSKGLNPDKPRNLTRFVTTEIKSY